MPHIQRRIVSRFIAIYYRGGGWPDHFNTTQCYNNSWSYRKEWLSYRYWATVSLHGKRGRSLSTVDYHGGVRDHFYTTEAAEIGTTNPGKNQYDLKESSATLSHSMDKGG